MKRFSFLFHGKISNLTKMLRNKLKPKRKECRKNHRACKTAEQQICKFMVLVMYNSRITSTHYTLRHIYHSACTVVLQWVNSDIYSIPFQSIHPLLASLWVIAWIAFGIMWMEIWLSLNWLELDERKGNTSNEGREVLGAETVVIFTNRIKQNKLEMRYARSCPFLPSPSPARFEIQIKCIFKVDERAGNGILHWINYNCLKFYWDLCNIPF